MPVVASMATDVHPDIQAIVDGSDGSIISGITSLMSFSYEADKADMEAELRRVFDSGRHYAEERRPGIDLKPNMESWKVVFDTLYITLFSSGAFLQGKMDAHLMLRFFKHVSRAAFIRQFKAVYGGGIDNQDLSAAQEAVTENAEEQYNKLLAAVSDRVPFEADSDDADDSVPGRVPTPPILSLDEHLSKCDDTMRGVRLEPVNTWSDMMQAAFFLSRPFLVFKFVLSFAPEASIDRKHSKRDPSYETSRFAEMAMYRMTFDVILGARDSAHRLKEELGDAGGELQASISKLEAMAFHVTESIGRRFVRPETRSLPAHYSKSAELSERTKKMSLTLHVRNSEFERRTANLRVLIRNFEEASLSHRSAVFWYRLTVALYLLTLWVGMASLYLNKMGIVFIGGGLTAAACVLWGLVRVTRKTVRRLKK